MIQEEAFRCKSITEKLLDFSRCDDIQRERTDLAGLIQGVVEMIRHMGKYRGKKIVFQPREAVMAHVDGQEIKQVVLNLVVNALDSHGGRRHAADRRSGTADGMAEMVFTDNGCGMPPEVLENIFEPFFTKRRVGKGTGLGLSITHRIISQHHGEITATSPGEGQGATFTVRLPDPPVRGSADEPRTAERAASADGRGPRDRGRRAASVSARLDRRRGFRPRRSRRSSDGSAEASAVSRRRRVSMEKSHQGGLRILFADDEAHLRDLMQMELPRLGHEVTVCPDGAAAIKALEKGSYDAALLDLRMPGMTGIEVLGKVRQISPDTQVDHPDRPRHRRHRRPGAAARGVRLPDQAVQVGRAGGAPQPGRRAPRPDQQGRPPWRPGSRPPRGRRTLIGETPAMQAVRRLIDTIAPTDASVMILGETGTGKELIARNLHDKSQRAGHAVHPGQLRRPAREPRRERAVRPPQGGVHRRRHATARGSSRSPTAAPCSSTRSASSTRACRSSCCGSSSRARSAASARTSRSASTSGSSAPPTATSAR